jgi:hypothetical protein
VRLAAEAGEVSGGCWQWESIKSIWRQGLDSGNVFIVLQVNSKPHPELAKVPNAIDFAGIDNAKQILKFGGHDPAAITRPYAVAPGTPKDRVQLLRTAFTETLKDPNSSRTPNARVSIPIRLAVRKSNGSSCNSLRLNRALSAN